MSPDTRHVALPTTIPTKSGSPTRTPLGSPSRGIPVAITIGQKQALIDNLQLEITERARKLRAQYALQAQGLRSRIEMRINRIPAALRKTKMGDLITKDEAQKSGHNREGAEPSNGIAAQPPERPRSILEDDVAISKAKEAEKQHRKRGSKRTSDEMDMDMDKENAVYTEDLCNPKKRVKTAATTTRNPQANRATSRAKVQPSQVLSPKSYNSRTFPQSPFRAPAPPPKPKMPVTAAVSGLGSMAEKAKVTRAPSGKKTTKPTTKTTGGQDTARAIQPSANQRVAAAVTNNNNNKRVISHSSEASDVTTATVVTKSKTGGGKIVGKGKGVGVSAAGGRKPAQAKEDNAAAAAPSRRVLRKRT